MGGSVKRLHIYTQKADANGCVVGSWAIESALPGVAKCKFCECTVIYKSGAKSLTSHSETKKHKDNVKRSKHSSSQSQLNIDEALRNAQEKTSEEKQLAERTRKFEISLARSISHHKISFEFLDCLTTHLKTHCSDSAVIENMRLFRSKAEYVVKNGISKTYTDETIRLLKSCDGFSIGFDESEVNKTSELEILVQLSKSGNGVQLRHYRTIDLESGKAEVIVRTLLQQFDEDGVDYRSKMITSMTDGCNTMEGRLGGVKVKLQNEIKQFIDFGSCNDHHISNAMKHAVKAFDSDVEHVVVNIYQDLGGAKGKGLKKKKDFEKVCEQIGITTPTAFKKYGSTRFRSIRQCLIPVVDNWEGIVKYYSSLKTLTERQQKLKEYFVDREYNSLMNIYFILAAIRELIEGIDYFEMSTILLHESRRKMEEILRNQITKWHCESAVKMLGDDDESTVLKSGAMLLEVNLDNSDTILNNKRIFIGDRATQLITNLELNPKSPQLKPFFSRVRVYYQVLTKNLIKYFSKGLQCTALYYMSALAPRNCQQIGATHKIMYLANRFSKIIENIAPHDGLDEISDEIRSYSCDVQVKSLSEKPYEQFWVEVHNNITDGESLWPKYPVLSRFALSLATGFHANSDTERAFSVETDIHRNPKKNRMSQDMLDAHMQVHYGVNQKSNVDLCATCSKHKANKTHIPRHCHCCVAEISEEMLEKCGVAWKEHKAKKPAEESVSNELKSQMISKEAAVRRLKFTGKLKTRLTLYPDALTQVYVDEKKTPSAKSTAATSGKPAKSTATSATSAKSTAATPGKPAKSTAATPGKPAKSTATSATSAKSTTATLKRKATNSSGGDEFTPFPPKAARKTKVGE